MLVAAFFLAGSTVKRPPSRGGPQKGGADGGANLEDQSPPSDGYGDGPIRFHMGHGAGRVRGPELRRRLFQRGVDRRVGRVERCAEAIHSRDDGERNTRRDQRVFNRGRARLIRQKALK